MININPAAILSPLELANRLPDMFRSLRADSLIDYTKPTRVEPIGLIDHTIADLPVMQNLSLSITSLFAAYYLQAVAVSTNINNIEVTKILEKLNPSRDPIDAFGNVLSLENRKLGNLALSGFGLENRTVNVKFAPKEIKAATENNYAMHPEDESGVLGTTMTNETQKQIATLALNLSTGVLLNVEIAVDEHRATIPVSVRLITTITDPRVLKQMIQDSAKDRSTKARYIGYKTGELSLKDLMFATDLIDARRESLIKDNTGNYAEIIRRKNKNRLSGLISGNPSVATASNIMVISKDTLADIEGEIGGKVSNYKLRQRIFKDTYLILMVVVDPRWEQVTIYHRGIPLPTELNFKDLQKSNSNNIDVNEMLKLYQQGRNPTF